MHLFPLTLVLGIFVPLVTAPPIFERLTAGVWEFMQYVYLDPVLEHEILFAARYNDWEAIEHLLENPRANPSLANNFVLERAATHGDQRVVDMILRHPKLDLASIPNRALLYAIEFGGKPVVKRLLLDERIDASAGENAALMLARLSHQQDIVELLLENHRVQQSLPDVIAWKSDNGDQILPASKEVLNGIKRLDVTASSNSKVVSKPVKKSSGVLVQMDKENAQCTICLNEYVAGTRIGMLPCGHHADIQCMERWLSIQSVCPICKREIGTRSQLQQRLGLAQ